MEREDNPKDGFKNNSEREDNPKDGFKNNSEREDNPKDGFKNNSKKCNPAQVLRMNPGYEENSYTQNSSLQKKVIYKARSILENTIREFFNKGLQFPKCFVVADLGCASGPQSLVALSQIIDCLASVSQEVGHRSPDLQVFLNDLPGNDFNSIFLALPTFYEKLKQEKGDKIGSCYVSGCPGSFFGRLFPDRSIHLVHGSYSVHWLSQVPKGMENIGNIYVAKSSPDTVIKSYYEQFANDFSYFLRSRAEEVVSGGKMMLTCIGRTTTDPTDCCVAYEMLAKSLLEIASEGLINETDVDTFDLPFYNPSPMEIRNAVEYENSFIIDHMEVFPLSWDPYNDEREDYVFDRFKSGRSAAKHTRAITESMLVSHFGIGDSIIDHVFKKFAMFVGEIMSKENKFTTSITLSMTRK